MPIVTETLADRFFARSAAHGDLDRRRADLHCRGRRRAVDSQFLAPPAIRRRIASQEQPRGLRPSHRKEALASGGRRRASTESTGETRDVDFLGPPLAPWGVFLVLGKDRGSGPFARPLGRPTEKCVGRKVWLGSPGSRPIRSHGPGRRACRSNAKGCSWCPTPRRLGRLPSDLATAPCAGPIGSSLFEEPARLPPPRWGRAFRRAEARWLTTWRETLIRRTDGRALVARIRAGPCSGAATGELASVLHQLPEAIWDRTEQAA